MECSTIRFASQWHVIIVLACYCSLTGCEAFVLPDVVNSNKNNNNINNVVIPSSPCMMEHKVPFPYPNRCSALLPLHATSKRNNNDDDNIDDDNNNNKIENSNSGKSIRRKRISSNKSGSPVTAALRTKKRRHIKKPASNSSSIISRLSREMMTNNPTSESPSEKDGIKRQGKSRKYEVTRSSMVAHDLLSAEEEQKCGTRIQEAKMLKFRIEELLAKREKAKAEKEEEEENKILAGRSDPVLNKKKGEKQQHSNKKTKTKLSAYSNDPYDYYYKKESGSYYGSYNRGKEKDEYNLNSPAYNMYQRSRYDKNGRNFLDSYNSIFDTYLEKDEAFNNSDDLISYMQILESNIPIEIERMVLSLTEDDVQKLLPSTVNFEQTDSDDKENNNNTSNGRRELYRILMEGAMARDKLIRCNIRLVMNIAKKWIKKQPTGKTSASLYSGAWGFPSLDELMQEGILGLGVAVDRFDPERKFKFSTYATYWITNSIRLCHQSAATGCLRVPPIFHAIKNNFKKVSREYYELTGSSPTIEYVAKVLGLSEDRLMFVLQTTRPLYSLDSPSPSAFGRPKGRPGQAGIAENEGGDNDLANAIISDEPMAQERLEVSMLRQRLENAMASELSPHERDVLRLRLGLDDGKSRSIREVVEVCGGTLTVNDVRQTELKALRKLRSPFTVQSYQFLSYLDLAGVDASIS